MVFHGWASGFLTIPDGRLPADTFATESDLEDAATDEGNLGDRREFDHGSHVQAAASRRRLKAASSRSVDLLA